MAKGVGVEDIFKCVNWIEKCIKEGVGRQEGEKLAIWSTFVCEIDWRVENQSELRKVVNKSFESSHDKSLIHDLSESIAEGSWFSEAGLESGISLICSDQSIKGYVISDIRLRRSLTALSCKNPQKQGSLTALKESSYLCDILDTLPIYLFWWILTLLMNSLLLPNWTLWIEVVWKDIPHQFCDHTIWRKVLSISWQSSLST